MPGWIESRILLAEKSIEDLYRRILDILDALKAIRASLRANAQEMPGSAPSDGGGGVFVCLVPSAVQGTPPTAAAAFSATVYQMPNMAVKGTFDVAVGIPGPTVANKWGYCLPDGAGGYVLISQSCQ